MKLIALPSCLTMSAALSGISVRERGSAIEVDAANSRLAVEESGERRPRSKSNTKRLIVSAGCWKSKAMDASNCIAHRMSVPCLSQTRLKDVAGKFSAACGETESQANFGMFGLFGVGIYHVRPIRVMCGLFVKRTED